MTFLSEIEKIRGATFIIAILGIIFFISPGSLIIFYFFKDSFLTMDISKLLLLSISFVSPIIVVNTFLFAASWGNGNDEDLFLGLFLGLLSTSLVFYLSLVLAYFFKLSFVHYLNIVALLEALVAVYITVGNKNNKK